MNRRLTCLFSRTAFCVFFIIHFHTVNSQLPAAAIPVSDRIVLTVGPVHITEYEVRKNYVRFQQEYKSSHGHLPGKDPVDDWVREFGDRTYILADAWDKGYFEKREVNHATESMARLIIGQPGGLLEKKLVAPQEVVTEAEWQRAVDRSRKQLYIEYLKFSNYDQALDAMGGMQPENLAVFRKAVDKLSNDSSIVHRLDTFSWPAAQLGIHEDYITELEKGALTSVLALHDVYYVMYVQNTGMGAMPDIQRRNIIKRLLIVRRKEKAKQEYYRVVKKEAAIVINPDVLQALKKKLAQYGTLRTFDKNKFSELLPLEAFTYTRNQNKIRVTITEFVDYYNNLPLKKEINSIEMVALYMHAYVLDDFAYNKAEELGIIHDLQFRLDKENYKKTVIGNLYETNELRAAIEVTDLEIRDRYEMRKQDFIQAAEAKVSMFVFDTRDHAMAGRSVILSPRAGAAGRLTDPRQTWRDSLSLAATIDGIDTTRLIGLLRKNFHHMLPYNEHSIPDTIQKVIFSMPVREMTRPMPFNGQYMVIVKESESGQRVQLLTEVKDKLQVEIAEEKFKYKKQELLEQLKQKYKLEGRVEDVLSSERAGLSPVR